MRLQMNHHCNDSHRQTQLRKAANTEQVTTVMVATGHIATQTDPSYSLGGIIEHHNLINGSFGQHESAPK